MQAKIGLVLMINRIGIIKNMTRAKYDRQEVTQQQANISLTEEQSRTVTDYIYLSTVLKYNFEGSVLYSSIIFWEYSWLYSSTFERQILYSLLRYISIHNREYPLLLLKNKK